VSPNNKWGKGGVQPKCHVTFSPLFELEKACNLENENVTHTGDGSMPMSPNDTWERGYKVGQKV